MPIRLRPGKICHFAPLHNLHAGTSLVNVLESIAGLDYTLPPCPSSPNCISSQATDNHFIDPFTVTGDAKAAFSILRDILAKRHDTTIVSANEKMIRVEFKTSLGFVDDGLFVLDMDTMVIHLRSASRVGYWDLGKNRARIERIRQEYQNYIRIRIWKMKKVLGTIVLLAVAAACVFGGWQFYQKQNSITVVFDEAKGLQPGALVQLAGIDIGKVRDLTIAEDGIEVSIRLDRTAKKRLSANALFVIDPNPEGGKPALVLVKDGAPGGLPLTAQTRIRGVNSVVLWQLSDLSKQLGQMMDSPPVRDFVNNLKAFEKEMAEAIRNFDDEAMQKRLEKKIRQLTEEFEQIMHETDARQKLEQMSITITRLSEAISRVEDSAEAKRLGQALDDLGRKVQQELAARK